MRLKPDLWTLLRHAAYHADMPLDDFGDLIVLLGLGETIGEDAPLCLSAHVVALMQARSLGLDREQDD